MIFDWYKVFNKTEFVATGLTSREITLDLSGIGSKTFLVTKGNLISVLIDDIYLSLDLNSKNPFIFGNMAIILDTPTQDVYVGYLHAD
jgi:hypothetical protein